MANLIIKSSADNLVLQGSDASPAITVGATGTTTFAENATLSGTANALGTVATGNLSNNNIVMPRFKEHDSFYWSSQTSTSTTGLETLNISGTLYNTITPEATGDILEFSYNLNTYVSAGYAGVGIQRSASTNFSSPTTVWSMGEHGLGQFGFQTSDGNEYSGLGGTICQSCSWATVDTPYYFRMIGLTHTSAGSFNFGTTSSGATNSGVYLTVKRWSIV